MGWGKNHQWLCKEPGFYLHWALPSFCRKQLALGRPFVQFSSDVRMGQHIPRQQTFYKSLPGRGNPGREGEYVTGCASCPTDSPRPFREPARPGHVYCRKTQVSASDAGSSGNAHTMDEAPQAGNRHEESSMAASTHVSLPLWNRGDWPLATPRFTGGSTTGLPMRCSQCYPTRRPCPCAHVCLAMG